MTSLRLFFCYSFLTHTCTVEDVDLANLKFAGRKRNGIVGQVTLLMLSNKRCFVFLALDVRH